MLEGPESVPPAPEGLTPASTQLWDALTSQTPLDAGQLVTLTEICRVKDRLDQYDAVLRGDADTWRWLTAGTVAGPGRATVINIDAVLARANADTNLLKLLLTSLRLPDPATGKRPQRINGTRNAPIGRLGPVTSLDRARRRPRG